MPNYTPGQRYQVDGQTATAGPDGVLYYDEPAAPQPPPFIPAPPPPSPRPAPPELAAALRPGGPGLINPTTGAFTAPADPESEDMDALYNTTFQRERAKKDIARIEAASAGVGNAASMLSTARQAREFLDDGAPTGPGAAFRLSTGKVLGGVLGGVAGIPNTEQTNALTGFTQIAEGLALGDADKLKGPMSDRDIELLRNMNASPNDTPEANRRAIAGREWAAARLMAYEAAQTRWAQELGRPSSVNRAGQSFDQWWAQYAAENIPPPTGSGPYTIRPRAPRQSPQQRALASRFESDKQRIAELARRPAPPRAQAAPARVRTSADYARVAPGASYIDPDGVRRTKPKAR